jgi:hypothetical protein
MSNRWRVTDGSSKRPDAAMTDAKSTDEVGCERWQGRRDRLPAARPVILDVPPEPAGPSGTNDGRRHHDEVPVGLQHGRGLDRTVRQGRPVEGVAGDDRVEPILARVPRLERRRLHRHLRKPARFSRVRAASSGPDLEG